MLLLVLCSKVEKVCAKCISRMEEEELENWYKIQEILDGHDYPNHEQGVMLNFN